MAPRTAAKRGRARHGSSPGADERALQHLPEAALLVDGRGRVVAASPLARALLGAAVAPGSAVVEAFARADRRRLREEVARAARGRRRRFTVEAAGRSGDGVAVEVSAGPWRLSGAERALLLLRDVREERARDAELKRKQEALETLARFLADASSAGTVRAVCKAAATHVSRLVGPSAAVSVWLEETPTLLRVVAEAGPELLEDLQREDGRPALRDPHGTAWHIYHAVRETGRTIVVRNARADPLTREHARHLASKGVASLVLSPIAPHGRMRGTIAIALPEPGEIDPANVRLLSEIARSVGIAIENLERLEEARRQLADTELVRNVSAEMTGTLALDPLLRRVSRALARLADVTQCFILLHDSAEDVLVGVASTVPLPDLGRTIRIPVRGVPSLAVTVWREKRSIAVQDARKDPRTNKRLVRLLRERSLLCAPLLIGDRAIGVVMLGETRGLREFRPDEVARVETVANQAALAIENARRLEDAIRARDRAELLLDVVRTASASVQMHQCLSRIAERLVRLTGASRCSILIPDERCNTIVDVVQYGARREIAEQLRTFVKKRIDELPVARRFFDAEGAVVVRDVVRERAVSARTAKLFGLREVLFVPVRSSGQLLALMALCYAEGARILEEEVATAEGVARQVALAVANARAFEEIARQQRALDMLTSRIIGAQEDERRRIARELHDGVSQALTAAKITFERLVKSIAHAGGRASPQVLDELERGTGAIGEAIREVRRICMDLRPSQLDHLGFAATVTWYAKSFSERSGLDVRVHVDELPPLTPEMEINLYRIVQEALSNVVKHAGAKRADLRIRHEAGKLVLTLEDDGRGFDPAGVERRREHERGMGLLTMSERAHLLRGELRVRSEERGGEGRRPGAGRGTRVEVVIPIAERGEDLVGVAPGPGNGGAVR